MKFPDNIKVKFIIITIFSISMAYLESAVVVYLRMIYYPDGFQFPLSLIPPVTYLVETGRELSTLLMLAAIGYLAGKSIMEKFFYFLFSFGIWDTFYYVWLKVLLNWPAFLLENDILFLIPVPWVGPVIAPVIVSLTMIFTSAAGIYRLELGYNLSPGKIHVFLTALGLLIILISFLWSAFSTDLLIDPAPAFQWGIFLAGEAVLLSAIFLYFKGMKVLSTS